MTRGRAAISLTTAGLACLGLVALLHPLAWRGMQDVSVKEIPALPPLLMALAAPVVLELLLLPRQPLFGVLFVLRLFALLLLSAGAVVGMKAAFVRRRG